MVLPYCADGHVSSTMCWCLAERLVQDISGALENCHAAGYLHLDVSRGNILVDGTRFGLSDFGLARQEKKRDFDENYESGTPYESPLIVDRAQITTMVDWHSLFFVVYELVHGSLPWDNLANPAIVARRKHELLNRDRLGGIPESLLRKVRPESGFGLRETVKIL